MATTNNVLRLERGAAAVLLAFAGAVRAAAPVELEQMTWPELRQRIAAGATTVLLPIGGTEQNGPHMLLGKHNRRVQVLAERIAETLGDTIVAPVLAYVPEGGIAPPTQHMRWPGTISVPVPAFEALLDGSARSLRQHGFCQIVFVGDHGGYRASLERVAAALNKAWAPGSRCRADALPEYYRAAASEYDALLKARGFAAAEIGSHAGLADTSLALAVDPALVRAGVPAGRDHDGVSGDPRQASAELGRLGIDHIVAASVAAIRARRPAAR